MSLPTYEMLEKENRELKKLIVQFKSLLDSIPDPVFMKDKSLSWIYGNPIILDLYNIDKENYIGKTEDQLLPKEFAVSCMESDRQAVEKRDISKSEERARDKEGNLHFYEVFKVPTYNKENGNFEGLIGVGRDITERKAYQEALEIENKKRKENEQALAELMETLEQKVLRRTEELDEQRRKAEYLATIDVLTGLYNRRAFYKKMYLVDQASRTYNTTYSIAILDIDLFKNINDTYGHAIGDEALKKMSTVMQNTVRSSDFVGRIGGEEFAILYVNTPLEDALKLAEELRLALENIVFNVNETVINLSASFGVSTFYSKSSSCDTIMAKADEALYQAKAAGRNCVVG